VVALKLIRLLVVPGRELEVSGNDARLLVVACDVTGQLENLRREIFEDSSEVGGGGGTQVMVDFASSIGSDLARC
jgi:hypothetical protein